MWRKFPTKHEDLHEFANRFYILYAWKNNFLINTQQVRKTEHAVKNHRIKIHADKNGFGTQF